MTHPIAETQASGLSQLHEQTIRVARAEALVNIDADPQAAKEIAEGLGLPIVALSDMRKAVSCSPTPRPRPGNNFGQDSAPRSSDGLGQVIAGADFGDLHHAAT
ncbi:hypothetical protein OM788_006580 [Streptomyces sp. KA12]|uniref:hypothetical protein n=1 Tax=Streptomyces sp. KA12 TaxID=2991730 RepID=UPI0023AF148B|nr:hypothetical protein [Streptomyces sp. KA12]MDF0376582.1 hypothetical protein [Streptomyces sp. KA12]